MRDGKSMGIYHSLDDAKRIVANNKRTNKYSKFKIQRKPRSKMAGPVGQLPEQGVAEGSGQEPGDFEIYDLRTMQRVYHPFEADDIMDAFVKADDWLEAIGKSGRGLSVRPVKEQGVAEGLADDFMKMAQARGYNPRKAGTPKQERERTQQMLAQRAKDRAAQPAPQGPNPERRAELQAKLKELEAQFDPNYEYSDDHSFWSRQNAIAQQIQGIRQQLSITEISKQKLGDYLHAAHRDIVDRVSSSSFQSGQAGDRYNRADVSAKEKQREKGMQRAVKKLSVAEAWARRYPDIDKTLAEAVSAGDQDQVTRLTAIKEIIESKEN